MVIFGFVITGCIPLIYGSWRVYRVASVHSYEKTEAIIEDTGLIVCKRPEVYVDITYYVPTATYRYQVSGQEYTGDVIFPYKKYAMFTDEIAAKQFITHLQETKVVFYDGSGPSRAVLYIPSKGKILRNEGGLPIAGILLISFALLVWSLS